MGKPTIRKLGTIECDLVEATPVVFRGRLYRFEYVRRSYKPNMTGDSYFRFVDVATGEHTPAFARGFHLGSAFVEGGTAYAYGVTKWDEPTVHVFWSSNLEQWSSRPALYMEDWGLFNTSVCRGPDRYVMAFEVGRPDEVVGVRFTNYFATSDNLLHWEFMGLDQVYSKDRYTACPTIRYHNGFYYMLYLECVAGPAFEQYMVRTTDFVHWEPSPLNPVLAASDEDRQVRNKLLTEAQRERIAGAVNINNSDIDLCEHDGRVYITYSWGNQQGVEHLAEAEFDGPLDAFLEGWFPAD